MTQSSIHYVACEPLGEKSGGFFKNFFAMEESRNYPLIGIVAGEISGDILGAGLMRALKIRYPKAQFIGILGEKMLAEGGESLVEMEEIAVMGLSEVVKHLPRLLKIRRLVIQHMLQQRPDIFIGIDAPDFNLAVELKLKQQGIKTLHYVSPSVWAWRQKRIHKIAQATNQVLALLPFEKAFYDKFNVPCRFIGHTLADQIALKPDRNEACALLQLDPLKKYVAILPGSRHSELAFLTEPFLQAAQILKQQLPEIQLLVPLTSEQRLVQFTQLKQQIAPNLELMAFKGSARQAMIAAQATLLASGTATLEAMLCKSPMVVGYKMKATTYQLAKRLVKTNYIALPNLLANEMLVAELIQQDCQGEKLAEQLLALLQDSEQSRQRRHQLIQRFTDLHRLIQLDADKQAAEAVEHLLEGEHAQL